MQLHTPILPQADVPGARHQLLQKPRISAWKLLTVGNGGRVLKEEELVAQLNELLGMEHKLPHDEHKETVDRIYILGEQSGEYRGQLH
jgi:hypothetical protein